MIDLSHFFQHKYKLREARRKIFPPLLLLLPLAFLILFLLIWQSIEVTRLGYRVAELQLERKELHTLKKQLTAEVNRLRAPHRIEKLGEELGLKEKLPKIVFLKMDVSTIKKEKAAQSDSLQNLKRFSKRFFGGIAKAETVERDER
jgi:hypothetical protein